MKRETWKSHEKWWWIKPNQLLAMLWFRRKQKQRKRRTRPRDHVCPPVLSLPQGTRKPRASVKWLCYQWGGSHGTSSSVSGVPGRAGTDHSKMRVNPDDPRGLFLMTSKSRSLAQLLGRCYWNCCGRPDVLREAHQPSGLSSPWGLRDPVSGKLVVSFPAARQAFSLPLFPSGDAGLPVRGPKTTGLPDRGLETLKAT